MTPEILKTLNEFDDGTMFCVEADNLCHRNVISIRFCRFVISFMLSYGFRFPLADDFLMLLFVCRLFRSDDESVNEYEEEEVSLKHEIQEDDSNSGWQEVIR